MFENWLNRHLAEGERNFFEEGFSYSRAFGSWAFDSRAFDSRAFRLVEGCMCLCSLGEFLT